MLTNMGIRYEYGSKDNITWSLLLMVRRSSQQRVRPIWNHPGNALALSIVILLHVHPYRYVKPEMG